MLQEPMGLSAITSRIYFINSVKIIWDLWRVKNCTETIKVARFFTWKTKFFVAKTSNFHFGSPRSGRFGASPSFSFILYILIFNIYLYNYLGEII